MKEVLNGGYNVHPVPPPNSEIKERITKRYERQRINIDNAKDLSADDMEVPSSSFHRSSNP
jgi:hypothetical protein